jgi:hypothetical protein
MDLRPKLKAPFGITSASSKMVSEAGFLVKQLL